MNEIIKIMVSITQKFLSNQKSLFLKSITILFVTSKMLFHNIITFTEVMFLKLHKFA